MVGYADEIVTEYEGTEEFDPFEHIEENIEITPDSPPETQWYHGRLDRAVAEKRLKEGGLPGSYLIRESDGKPGVYVLSFLNHNRIDHFKITAMCGEYYIGGREFKSLSVLIGYYTGWSDLLKNKRLMQPVPPPEPVFDSKLVKSIVPYMKIPDTDELSFVEGEVFTVHNDMGDGWIWVTSALTEKSGIINQELVQELNDPVNQYSWFHASMPRDEIATTLANMGSGSWLVRKSETTQGDFTLYFFCKLLVQKFKIQKRSAGVYFMGGRTYNSVAEVIERYSKENLVEGYRLEKPVLREPADSGSPSSDFLANLNPQTVNTVKHSNGSNFFLNRKDNIVLKGNLNKKSQKTKKWKKMFFVLNETEQQLFYFDNERRSKPKGLINLNNTSLYPVHDSLFGRPNVFLLVSKELNQTSLYYLCSDTTDIAQEWTQKLRAHCTLSQPPQQNTEHKANPSQSLTELRSVFIKIFDVKFNSSKHSFPHPYCIVSLNDAKVCRTQITALDKKCWDEDFLIDDIPSDVTFFIISIYNKEKMSKDKELYRMTVKIDSLQTDVEENQWHTMTSSSKMDPCQLRVSIRFRHEVIMPVEHYLPLSQLLHDKSMELVILLEELCSKSVQDRNCLASSLLNLFRHEHEEISLIKKFIERDIEREENKDNLFRANTFGSSLMDQYMKMVASPFLHKAVQATINKTLKISPETNYSEDEEKKVIKNLLSDLLQDIIDSSGAIPSVLSHIFYCLQSKVSEKWDSCQVRTRGVSAFLFLRFICPVLTNPRIFNLITETPSSLSLRMLKSLANCLIRLANLTDFKETSMKSYNEFLLEKRPTIIDFINQASRESTEHSSFGPSSVDMSRCLATIHRLSMSKRDDLKLTECQPITRKLLAVTDELNSYEQNLRANKNSS